MVFTHDFSLVGLLTLSLDASDMTFSLFACFIRESSFHLFLDRSLHMFKQPNNTSERTSHK
jgi:hypothetical protein